MKKIFLLLVIVSGLAVGANAQSKEETQVANAVENMRKAMISGNKTELENVASDNLSYGHSSGKLQNKAEFVEAIVNKSSVFVSITLTDQTIKVTGNTAVVRHLLDAQTNDGGKPGNTKLGVLLVF